MFYSYSRQRFISERGDNVTCQFCGENFVSNSYGQKYCSYECNSQAQRREARLRREAEHPPIKKTCKECQKEFKTVIYGAKFCSTYCRERSEAKEKLEKWASREPKKRKRQNLSMQMFYELGDKPSDSALKKCNACRG